MQAGIHGTTKRSRLPSMGKYETNDRSSASGTGWDVGEYKGTYAFSWILSTQLDSYFIDNFDDYWRIAYKVTPTTTPIRANSPPPTSVSMHSRPPSADPAGAPDKDGAYNVRSVPVRMYLPDGPVLQDLAPPMLESGKLTRLFRVDP